MSCITGLPWSEDDLLIVKENYLTKSIEEIMQMLSVERTPKSIKSKAAKLGIHKKQRFENSIGDQNKKYKDINGIHHKICIHCLKYFPIELKYFQKDNKAKDGFRNVCKECQGRNFKVRIFWNEDEDKILYCYYAEKTNKEIHKDYLPHRTIEEINTRANFLKLKKNKETFSKAVSESMTIERRNAQSKLIIETGRYKGENNPMFGSHRLGELNPNWKNGITEVYRRLRENITQWKLYSMQQSGYKDVLNGESFDDVHHLYSFESIVEETFNELGLDFKKNIGDYSLEEWSEIDKKILEVHYRYPVGVCLSRKNHLLFHATYGYRNNTPEQFEEFSLRYKLGEFKEVSCL